MVLGQTGIATMFNSSNQKRLLEGKNVFIFSFSSYVKDFLLFCSWCLSAKAILLVKRRSVSSA